MGVKNLSFIDNNPPQCDAEFLNSAKGEINNVITSTGESITTSDLNQLGSALTEYASGADFYTDSGAADAYVLTVVGSKRASTQYFNGMSIRFLPGNTNTGASTVNVSTLGSINIKLSDGSTDPAAGDLVADKEVQLSYDGANFRLVLFPGVGGNPITTQGDIVTGNASGDAQRVALGAAETFVRSNGTDALFSAILSGDLPAATTGAKGAAELLTAAESLIGTDSTRAMTASAFAGNKSLAVSGFYKFPAGLVVQWGFDVSSTISGTINFPTSFGTVYTVVCSVENSSAQFVSPNGNTTSGFTYIASSGTHTGIRWVALGSV